LNGSADAITAKAFSESWNRIGSVYSRDQFLERFHPIKPEDFRGKTVIEPGFGNGSLLAHVAQCHPARLVGVELGDTLEQTRRNLEGSPVEPELRRGDLTTANLGRFDIAYCIGVLHHLDSPDAGFESVLRHTAEGGRFHCWVYARDGNVLVRMVVEPVRRIASRLPWWITKYLIALPMVVPYFLYARLLKTFGLLTEKSLLRWLPLFGHTRWIAPEPLRFFHHVAFDQLVTPRTRYIHRKTVERWLQMPGIDRSSTYIVFRNGNSWKFGGRRE
jgi:SAM-dependent methyltransferase